MPKLDLEKATKKDLVQYIKNKRHNEKGLSTMKKDELVKFAKKVQKKHSVKKGGNYAPVGESKCSDAYDGFAAVDSAFKTMTFKGGKKQRGGQQSSGQTFFPPRYYDPKAPLPQEPKGDEHMMTAYGMANPVSGACRNLAPFPNSSGMQTGGKTKTKKTKKTKKQEVGLLGSLAKKMRNTVKSIF